MADTAGELTSCIVLCISHRPFRRTGLDGDSYRLSGASCSGF